jgi:hypothetical protein
METFRINKHHPESVWITGNLLAPLLQIIFLAFRAGTYWNAGFVTLYILFLFTAVVFSLPTIFLYGLAFKELAYTDKPPMLTKALLSLIAVGCLSVTFVILEKLVHFGYHTDTVVPLLTLLFSVTIAGFIYPVKIKEKQPVAVAGPDQA